ncbi:hypothetical protein JBE04_41935, partial [Streptomyces sp. PRKS01-29]|nr:hypothetical protein [Streptomyces sabulosicollis]
LPPAPSTPPSAGAGQGGPAQPGGHPAAPRAGEDRGDPDPAAGPRAGAPSADPRRSAGPSGAPRAAAPDPGGAAAGPQGATPSAGPPQAEAAEGSAAPSAPGGATPGHDAPHAAPGGSPAAPGHGTPGHGTPEGAAPPRPGAAAAPNAPGGATPGHDVPHAATPGAPATPATPATPGGPSAGPHADAGQAAPGHGTPHAAPHAAPGGSPAAPGGATPAQAGAGGAPANSPGSTGPYAAGAYGYPSPATPPQAAPRAPAEGEPQTPPHAFGPPAVTSFGAAAGSPSAGFGGPSGPSAPSGPGGGAPQASPQPKRRHRKTLIVVSAAVATALIAGVAALAIVKGNDDKGDRAKTDYDKMTHTPPADPGGTGGGNSKAPSGGSDGPDPSATKLETTGDVPTEYLGAWEGEIKESGESTGRIRRVVLSQGPVGAFVAETLTSDSDSFCQDSAKLKSVDSLLLIEDEEVDTSIPEDSCSTVGEQTLRIGNDGTLAWSTTDGSYEATLRPAKSGGKPIPSGYVGTWLAKDAFGKADATLKITIKQGAIGSVVAQDVADSKKYHCEGDRVLASVEKGLVLSPSKFTGGTPKNLCGSGTSLTFTSSGHDKLRVEYDDPDDYSDETMTQTFTRLD